MMQAVAVPSFERFYEEHRDAVFGLLVKRLGRQAAEDAFQETFFRALRAYPNLRHADHLRAWVLTIAEPFDWRFTRDDLAALITRLAAHEPQLQLAA